MKRVLYSILVLLLFSSCGPLFSDPDSVYETAIRHYIESWPAAPDTVVISVEGEKGHEPLRTSLSPEFESVISSCESPLPA